MILNGISNVFSIKLEGGNFFNLLFSQSIEHSSTDKQDKYDDSAQVVIHKFVEQVHSKLDKTDTSTQNRIKQLDSIFNNFQHLQYSMEAIGNAFNLQNASHKANQEIKTKALDIYVLLLEIALDDYQPFNKQNLQLTQQNKQSLIRQIFQHLSQSFQQLTSSHQKSIDQNFLKDVMRIFRKYSCQKNYFQMLDKTTWETILKLVMGIYDFIVHNRANSKASIIELLVDYTHLTIFDCFLHSGLQEQTLWKLFSERALNWLGNQDFMNKWQQITNSLTQRVTQIQYGLHFFDVVLDEGDISAQQKEAAREWLVIKFERPQISSNMSKSQSLKSSQKTKKMTERPFQSEYEIYACVRDDYACFLWIQFLHLFEQTVKIQNMAKYDIPIFNNCFIETLQSTVDILLSIGSYSKSKLQVHVISNKTFLLNPDAYPLDFIQNHNKQLPPVNKVKNTHNDKYLFLFNDHKIANSKDILSLFGKWLFQYGVKIIKGPEDKLNQIKCLKILSKVFRKSCGPFCEESLMKFYQIILNNLSEKYIEDYETLKLCSQLMKRQMPKVDILFKDYRQKLQETIHNNFNQSHKNEKYNMVKCLSNTLLFFPVRLSTSINIYGQSNNEKDEKQMFIDGIKLYNQYLEIQMCDKEIAQLILVVTSMSVMTCTLSDYVEDLFKIALKFDKIYRSKNGSAILDLFQALLTAGELVFLQRIKQYSKLDYSSSSKKQDKTLKETITIILRYFEFVNKEQGLTQSYLKYETDPISKKLKQKMLYLEIQVLYVWCLLFSKENQLFKSLPSDVQSLIGKMHKLFYELITLLKDFFLPQPDFCQQDSFMVYKSLLNNIGKYFIFFNTLFFETSIVSSTINQQPLSLSLTVNKDTLITFYKPDSCSLNEDLIITIRNYQGKFLWQGELVYKLIHDEQVQKSSNQQNDLKMNNECYINPTLEFMKRFQEQQVFEEEEEEDNLFQDNQPLPSANLEIPMNPQKRLSDIPSEQKQLINVIKLFLSHFGYLDIDNSQQIEYLQNSESLHQQLTELDTLPERCQIKVACYFLLDIYSKESSQAFYDTSHGASSEEHEPYLLAYNNFINQLGILLTKDTLTMGMFNSTRQIFEQNHKAKVYYSSNVFFETIYLPAFDFSFLPQAQIHILWNARFRDQFNDKMPNILGAFVDQEKLNRKHFYILITPNYKFQNYKVDVLQINKDLTVIKVNHGPLISGMLLNFENLCFFTQATIYNIQRQLNPQAFLEQFQKRKKKIQEITKRNKTMNENGDHVLQVFDTSQIQLTECGKKQNSRSMN